MPAASSDTATGAVQAAIELKLRAHSTGNVASFRRPSAVVEYPESNEPFSQAGHGSLD